MLPLNFDAPALKELHVLDLLSTQQMCYFWWWYSCVGWGETAIVDTEGHAASCNHSLTSFQVYCVMLGVYRATKTLLCYPFITSVFYVILVFIKYAVASNLQCFKTD